MRMVIDVSLIFQEIFVSLVYKEFMNALGKKKKANIIIRFEYPVFMYINFFI